MYLLKYEVKRKNGRTFPHNKVLFIWMSGRPYYSKTFFYLIQIGQLFIVTLHSKTQEPLAIDENSNLPNSKMF